MNDFRDRDAQQRDAYMTSDNLNPGSVHVSSLREKRQELNIMSHT